MSLPPHVPEDSKDHENLITIEPQPSQAQLSLNPEITGHDATQHGHGGHMDVPLATAFRNHSSDTLSNLSMYSADNENVRILNAVHSPIPPGRTPYVPSRSKSWRTMIEDSWIDNKGCMMVLLAQFFGAFMGATTRLLETDGAHGRGMHPFQILFVRMLITVSASSFCE
jgi:hypothetical protein